MNNIRNFCIISHVDHGKSTLADRMLELTHTIEKRKMQDQVLDSMELERERGITIKMQPVRMVYHPRRLNADLTQTDADEIQRQIDKIDDLLYADITYKIRGACFAVKKNIGLGQKEIVYQKALEIEFEKTGLLFESQKIINVLYDGKKVGTYVPDFVVEGKILVELKSLPEIGKTQEQQIWSYLKGCEYKLAMLINFDSNDVTFRRIVYDTSRDSESGLRQSALSLRQSAQIEDEYILNLIDTPGHIDFSYEVSRALKAVEGSILLVDSTQGVQAQTLTTLNMARESGLTIIPVLSKIDSPLARVNEVSSEVVKLLGCKNEDIMYTSGKTGEGVEALLNMIIEKVPPPTIADYTQTNADRIQNTFQALIFDFKYSTHRGVIVFVRVMSGSVSRNTPLIFKIAKEKFTAIEVGIFSPDERPVDTLTAGEIGYVVTGIKIPGIASVGDTVSTPSDTLPPLPGYMTPKPVVWASIYPESQDDFMLLKQALGKLRLSDSSYSYEEESSGALGRGFRCGFLGMLHLEIITERLKREFSLNLVVTMPTITYEVTLKNGKTETVYSPSFFPDDGTYTKVIEPWVDMSIISPTIYLGGIMTLLYEHEGEIGESENFGEDRARLYVKMPLREMMRNFFDKLKSLTSGYASVAYEIGEKRNADVTRLDILVADEVLPAFSRVVSKRIVEIEAEKAVEKLHSVIPRQMFQMKIQGKALGRIISSQTVSAFRKDVTQHMYGGDITRKMKLREKQKKGKKKMEGRGKVNIPQDVFLKMMRN
jgi:GTP-binding protein LepA